MTNKGAQSIQKRTFIYAQHKLQYTEKIHLTLESKTYTQHKKSRERKREWKGEEQVETERKSEERRRKEKVRREKEREKRRDTSMY